MFDSSERRTVILFDFESARSALESADSAPAAFASRLLSLARSLGRVVGATAYGTFDPELAKELRRCGLEARLTQEDGEGSSPESVAMLLDGSEALYRGPALDAVVLVTDDAQLSELVRRLRRRGASVTVVCPADLTDAEPARSADRALSIDALLAADFDASPASDMGRIGREPPARPRAPLAPVLDLDDYDWTRLVVLLRDLEAKMPFVGMRWLKNKVLGPHNVGVASMNDKQALLNRAVDDGLIETYRVGNREEAGDPVTACRLMREHPLVKELLEAHPAVTPAASAEGS